MSELKEISGSIQDFLRLRTLPVGVKFIEREEDIDKIEGVRKPAHRATLCQLMGQSRTLGWTLSFTTADSCALDCPVHLGWVPEPEMFLNGMVYAGVWQKTQEDASKFGHEYPKLPLGKYKAVVLSPLRTGRLDPPDVIMIFGTPAQMCLILCALQWEDYERFQFFFRGEGSCSDSLIECFLTGKPRLTVPCFGERIMGLVQEDEMEIGIPGTMAEKLLNGLEGLRGARTINYPIPHYGLQLDILPMLGRAYPGLEQILEKVNKGEPIEL